MRRQIASLQRQTAIIMATYLVILKLQQLQF